jgi:hypothetical protein
MNDPIKKTGLLVWMSAGLVVVLLGYPLSIGPACWISSWTGLGGETLLAKAYTPMLRACERGPEAISLGVEWYSQIGARAGWGWGEIVFPLTSGTEISGGYFWMDDSAP